MAPSYDPVSHIRAIITVFLIFSATRSFYLISCLISTHHYAHVFHIWDTITLFLISEAPKSFFIISGAPLYSYFSHIWVTTTLFLIFPSPLLSYFSYLAAITLLFLIFGLLYVISGPPFALFTYQDRLKREARHLWSLLRRPLPSWLAPTTLARLHLGLIKQASLVSFFGGFGQAQSWFLHPSW